MRKMLMLALSVLLLFHTSAQRLKIFRINPGEKIASVIPFNDRFDDSAFRMGEVYFRNDHVGSAKMNYNALFGEMQFINPNGDTLSLDDEATIKYIAKNKDTFYYQKGFLKVVSNNGKTKLAQRDFFTLVNKQKLGGMNEANASSIETYDAVSSTNYFKQLVAKELLTLGKNRAFFISDAYNNFKPLTKKGLQQYYSKKAAALKSYLDTHEVNLTDLAQVQALITTLDNQ